MRTLIFTLAVPLVLTLSANLPAANWPQWRGPNGNGTSPEIGLPASWSTKDNVVWRLELPGQAGSTPAIWGDRIFLTSAAGKEIVLLCASTDGKELWRKRLGTGNRDYRGDEGNSASPSPSTDGKHVWAMAGTGELFCFDFDGKVIWSLNLQEKYGRYLIQFGMASTPVLHQEALYLQCIHTGDPYLLALDASTGKEKWRRERKSDARQECEHAYSSPILYRDAERTLLLVHGADYLTAHKLDDGSEVWRCGDLNPQASYNETLRFVASPSFGEGLVIVSSAKNGPVHAIRPGGSGDVTTSGRAWSMSRETPDVPSPAVHDGLVYLLRETGALICLNAKDGARLYSERTDVQRHRTSPVVADGKVYCASTDGTVTVVQAGREFKVLATNEMGEHISATPVVSGGRVYLRSYKALWAIGAPPAAKPATAGGN